MKKINIEEYRYGKITKTLRNAISYINDEGISGDCMYFDYPDYGGLPKYISSRLSSDEVDFLQEQLQKGEQNGNI